MFEQEKGFFPGVHNALFSPQVRPFLPLIAASGGWGFFLGGYVVFGVLSALGVPQDVWIALGLGVMGCGMLSWAASLVFSVLGFARGEFLYPLIALALSLPIPAVVIFLLVLGIILGGLPTV